MKMQKIFFSFLITGSLSFVSPLYAIKREIKKRPSFKQVTTTFAPLHRLPSVFSDILSTINCGQTVETLLLDEEIKLKEKSKTVGAKKLTKEEMIIVNNWSKVKVGPYVGFIQNDLLKSKGTAGTEECLQDEYQMLFQWMELDVSEMYYWGRLHDIVFKGNSADY